MISYEKNIIITFPQRRELRQYRSMASFGPQSGSVAGKQRAPGSQLVFVSSQKARGSHIHNFQYMHRQSWRLFQKAGPKYCSGGTQLMVNMVVTC